MSLFFGTLRNHTEVFMYVNPTHILDEVILNFQIVLTKYFNKTRP